MTRVLLLAAALGAGIAGLAPGVSWAIEGRSMGCAMCGHPESYPWHYRGCRYYGLGLDSGGGASGGGGMSPDAQMMQAMSPILQQAAADLGASLGRAIFGDPVEDARRAEAARIEAARQAELARQRAIEEARRREELHRKLMGILKITGLADLSLKGFDGDSGRMHLKGLDAGEDGGLKLKGLEEDDDGLRPQGTSFFGLGGGAGAGPAAQAENDPMVVDLRNLRRASFLAEAAENAGPGDAQALMDEALRASQGDRTFLEIPPDGAVPVTSEKGLLEFQKANAEYRRARDFHHALQEKYLESQRRREAAVRVLSAAREDQARAPDDPARRHRFQEVLSASRLEQQAWERAGYGMIQSRQREALARSALGEKLREAVRPPDVDAEARRRERERLEAAWEEWARHKHPVSRLFREFHADSVKERMEKDYGFVRDPALNDRVQRLADRLRAASPFPEYPREIHVVDLPKTRREGVGGHEDNVAAAGDSIFVGRKYLERDPPPTDDEILFVLGHEVGHIRRDHAAPKMDAVLKQWAGDFPGSVLDPDQTTLSPVQRQWVKDQALKAQGLAELSRAQELESDRDGAALALAAGAKPGGIRDAFAWMRRKEAADAARARNRTAARQRLGELTRDHPEPEERLAILRGVYGKALGAPLEP